jgi:glycosyltransferase involved in cell wall biosynthesis
VDDTTAPDTPMRVLLDSESAPHPDDVTDPCLLSGRRVLVVASTFPNRIQPWMVNSTIQAIMHGAEVFIAATRQRGHTYQAAVDTYRLQERTIYVRTTEPGGLFDPVRYLFGASTELRRAAVAGLLRAFFWPDRLSPHALAKGVAIAVPTGIRGLSLVHSHSMTLGFEFLRVARSRRVPLVQTFHGLPPVGVDGLPPEKLEQLFEGAAGFLVNTGFSRGLLTDLGCPAGKIEILPQGTDLDEFPFHPRAHPGKEPIRFLSVGRLHEDKGHVYALRALARVAERGIDFAYHVVGYGTERPRLEKLATELGVRDRVEFLDEVDDDGLRREYRDAHVFLFPSLRDVKGKHEETQGVAMQEAQASGCLLVATRTGGIPESVDEEHARLVPDRDENALASAILDLVQQPERWPAWQSAGRRWVEHRYSVDVIGRRLAELYHQLLTHHENGR